MVATSFQAAGGAGQKGIDELAAQVAPVGARRRSSWSTTARRPRRKVEHAVHANTLAFNVVPLLGTLGDNGYTDEEMKLQNESRKILGIPELAVTPTCVRVPVMVGHSIAVRATFEREPSTSTRRWRRSRVPEPRRRRGADAAGVRRAATRRSSAACAATSPTRASSTSSSSATTCSRAPR